MKLKYLIVFVLSMAVQAWALGDVSSRGPFMVSTGEYYSCALDAAGLKCWGDWDGTHTVPALKSPTQVSVGLGHTCALDAEGVKCWGTDDTGKIYVPALKSPIQVSVGSYYTCALDAEGVKCWMQSRELLKVPALKLPTQVSAGGGHTCALDAEGVKCWGDDQYGKTIVPPLKNPVQVSAGFDHTCALDAEGVKCWGDNSRGQIEVPPLKNPVQVSAGSRHTCALDTEGVKCWGERIYGQSNVPPLTPPIQIIAAGTSTTCALDAGSVKCWGWSGEGQTHVPKLEFDLVKVAISTVNSTRSEYLKSIAKLVSEANSKTYYFECLLVSPALSDVDSSYFIESYFPRFKKIIGWLQDSFGYTGDILEIPDAEEHRKLAITSIQSALSVSLNFISPDQDGSLQESLRAAGVALAEPMSNQKILDVLKSVDALVAEKQKLRSSTKSAFLVDSLELAANYLREKVK